MNLIIITKGLFNTCFHTRVKYNMFTLITFSKIFKKLKKIHVGKFIFIKKLFNKKIM